MKVAGVLLSQAIVFLLLISSASADIIHVPSQYSTIQAGINAASNGDTVLVEPGLYIENIDFAGHNISVGSLYLTSGDTSYVTQTIIDGDASGSVVTFQNDEDSTALLTGFTIRNGNAEFGGGIYCSGSSPRIAGNIIDSNDVYSFDGGAGGGIFVAFADPLIEGNMISGNYVSGPLGGMGGGIYCRSGIPIIRRNFIEGNTADGYGGGIYCDNAVAIIIENTINENRGIFLGGGIYCKQSSPQIFNNIIVENYARWGDGGGILCDESSPTVVNTVFFQNEAGLSGGGLYCQYISNPILVNCIFWYNDAYEQDEIDLDNSSSPYFAFCDIRGGWAGEGNLDTDPLFRDPWNGDFYLMTIECGDDLVSPCIDAGSPDFVDRLLDCSWGHGEIRSDMGAYGGGDSTTVNIDDQTGDLPREFMLLQNYPNPFNASTVISYVLPRQSEVRIDIFDIMGRKVREPVEEHQQAGYHQIVWDAGNAPSGIYFYRIRAGQNAQSKEMLLLK